MPSHIALKLPTLFFIKPVIGVAVVAIAFGQHVALQVVAVTAVIGSGVALARRVVVAVAFPRHAAFVVVAVKLFVASGLRRVCRRGVIDDRTEPAFESRLILRGIIRRVVKPLNAGDAVRHRIIRTRHARRGRIGLLKRYARYRFACLFTLGLVKR
jgi:hypothetical protein